MALALRFPNGRLPSRRWRRVVVATRRLLRGRAGGGAVRAAELHRRLRAVHKPTAVASRPRLRAALTPFWFVAAASLVRPRGRSVSASGVPPASSGCNSSGSAYGGLLIPLTVVACLADGSLTRRSDAVIGVVLVAALRSSRPRSRSRSSATASSTSSSSSAGRSSTSLLTACVSRAIWPLLAIDHLIQHAAVWRASSRPARSRSGSSPCARTAAARAPARLRRPLRSVRALWRDWASDCGRRRTQAKCSRPSSSDVSNSLKLGYCAHLSSDGVRSSPSEARRTPRTSTVPLTYQGDQIGVPDRRARRHARHCSASARRSRNPGRSGRAQRPPDGRPAAFARTAVAAREEERLRLRRDLHDGLGPTLAALVFKIGVIREGARRDPDDTARRLRELGAETQSAIVDIRRLVYALRPPALDDLGLVGALREQAASLGRRLGSDVPDRQRPISVRCPPAVEVPPTESSTRR